MSDAARDSRGRCGPPTRILIAAAAVWATLGGILESAARADAISLNTGVAETGTAEGVVDTRWRVSHKGSKGASMIDEGVRLTTAADSPLPGAEGSATASHSVAPESFDPGLKTDDPADQTAEFTYYTKFELTKAQAASASIAALWISGGDTVEVTLNGDTALGDDPDRDALESWRELKIGAGAGFQAGVNVLEFHVVHHRREAGDPIGFQLEGKVSFPSKVPEPTALVLSTLSTLALAGLSWKRRLARRCD